MSEPTTNVLHFSLGSATNGIHISQDIDISDPSLTEKLDKMFELWAKCTINRKKNFGHVDAMK